MVDHIALFWSKVEKQPNDGCWLWTAARSQAGYGVYTTKGPWPRETLVHRISWMLLRGEIPEGFHLDHLCHSNSECTKLNNCQHRRCLNPDHLEPVTPAENLRRAHGGTETHCTRGHEYTGVMQANGRGRRCTACASEGQSRRQRETRRQTPPPPQRTHCMRGHEYTDDNIKLVSRGDGRFARTCLTCLRASQKHRRCGEPTPPLTHCPRGHEFSEANVYIQPSTGRRQCRACGPARDAEAKQRRAAVQHA